jgi:hypothetical protein
MSRRNNNNRGRRNVDTIKIKYPTIQSAPRLGPLAQVEGGENLWRTGAQNNASRTGVGNRLVVTQKGTQFDPDQDWKNRTTAAALTAPTEGVRGPIGPKTIASAAPAKASAAEILYAQMVANQQAEEQRRLQFLSQAFLGSDDFLRSQAERWASENAAAQAGYIQGVGGIANDMAARPGQYRYGVDSAADVARNILAQNGIDVSGVNAEVNAGVGTVQGLADAGAGLMRAYGGNAQTMVNSENAIYNDIVEAAKIAARGNYARMADEVRAGGAQFKNEMLNGLFQRTLDAESRFEPTAQPNQAAVDSAVNYFVSQAKTTAPDETSAAMAEVALYSVVLGGDPNDAIAQAVQAAQAQGKQINVPWILQLVYQLSTKLDQIVLSSTTTAPPNSIDSIVQSLTRG